MFSQLKSGIKQTAATIKTELSFYRMILAHPRTPRRCKVFLWVALVYLASPIDLIPDFVPVLGHLDDAIIVPLLIYAAMRSVPPAVTEECRRLASGKV